DQILRHECILTLRTPSLHVIEMAPRVAAVFSVVTQHKDAPAGHDHGELDDRGLRLCAVRLNCQIGPLIQRLAVDSQAIGFVATQNVISRQPDYSLDQVLGAGVGQHADKLECLTDWAALSRRSSGEPTPGIGEDDYLPALDAAELLYHYPIVDLQCVLHRNRRDQENLPAKHHHE